MAHREGTKARRGGREVSTPWKPNARTDADYKVHVQDAGRRECLANGTGALAVGVKDASGAVVYTKVAT